MTDFINKIVSCFQIVVATIFLVSIFSKLQSPSLLIKYVEYFVSSNLIATFLFVAIIFIELIIVTFIATKYSNFALLMGGILVATGVGLDVYVYINGINIDCGCLGTIMKGRHLLEYIFVKILFLAIIIFNFIFTLKKQEIVILEKKSVK